MRAGQMTGQISGGQDQRAVIERLQKDPAQLYMGTPGSSNFSGSARGPTTSYSFGIPSTRKRQAAEIRVNPLTSANSALLDSTAPLARAVPRPSGPIRKYC